VADDKRSAAKRAPAKRTSAKRAPANEPATKDWVDMMNETLAKVAETARHANAAEPAADGVATRASGSRWWPHRLRGGRA
jgi:hypothetical protein